MEQKHILMSALSVGIGVGVGFGLASGQTVSKWTGGSSSANTITADRMEQEILRLIVDGRNSKIIFDEFPYYLSEQTRVLLTSAAFVHLKKADFSKHTRNLSPASRTILLSGHTELYQQILAKALAHYFEAKLLLLDAIDFSLKIQSKYGAANKESVSFPNLSCACADVSFCIAYDIRCANIEAFEPKSWDKCCQIKFLSLNLWSLDVKSFKRSISETTLERISEVFGSFSMLQPREETKGTLRRQGSGVNIGSRGTEGSNPPKLRRNASASANMNKLTSQCTTANSGFGFSIENQSYCSVS
ncbi:hypothetical protein F0562_013174 [Nyssa sinensis]|uniref:Uncharacterized protein n=1 Tax=Nyssa sinensis TaxID=561372 RepID=A0A5J4ZUQ9_9ASTE|nr:hypothetical protein F0562_013174 [Nyssa sinensis]